MEDVLEITITPSLTHNNEHVHATHPGWGTCPYRRQAASALGRCCSSGRAARSCRSPASQPCHVITLLQMLYIRVIDVITLLQPCDVGYFV